MDQIMELSDDTLEKEAAVVFPFKIFQNSVNEYEKNSKIHVLWKVLSIMAITVFVLILVILNIKEMWVLKSSKLVHFTRITLFIIVWIIMWIFTAGL